MAGIFIANAIMRVGFSAVAAYLATHDHPVMAGWLIFGAIICAVSSETKETK